VTKNKGGRPPLPPSERMVRVHCFLPPSQVVELDALVKRAKAAGDFTATRNDLMRRAVFELVANATADAIMPPRAPRVGRGGGGRALRRVKP